MKIGKKLYVTNRKVWRAWLVENHKTSKEIWLIYYNKASGKPRIPYNDAVEEALCFGWIDSTVKKIDAHRFVQRFTPRRPGSLLSPSNKERMHRLIRQRRMTPAGLAAVSHAFPTKERFVIPSDILKTLKADKKVWRNFQKFPDSYKRIRIAFIESRRRHGKQQFQNSLQHFIKKTSRNKRFGFVQ